MNKEEVKKENEKLENCCKERDEYLDGWRREKANFLNYKKEESERFQALLDYKEELLFLEILPVLDSFREAEKNIPEVEKKNNDFIKGLIMIKGLLLNFLKTRGVEEMKCKGEMFDPRFHDASEMIESKTGKSGTISEEIFKGYLFNGKVLRAARVKVIK